ncbi:MAG: hypothetical protein Q7W05_12120 [Deltaproteobacteria bacterium]|nr:hypothetical protein [Deltaproteobacteria bacterium]
MALFISFLRWKKKPARKRLPLSRYFDFVSSGVAESKFLCRIIFGCDFS